MFLAALASLFATPSVYAQGTYAVQMLNGELTLDGRSDEEAWRDIEPVPLTMNMPVFEGEMTERSEIRLAYDEHFLYVSGRFFDGNPDGIRGRSLTRDQVNRSDDAFGVVLDTFNDNENALVFHTTPAGTRSDYAISDDARFDPEREPYNISWNTFWDVETVVDSAGWFAEMRIPFSSLRFQDDNGTVVMGIQTWRWIGRKAEQHGFPGVPPRWFMGHLKPSISRDIRFEGVFSRRPLYVTPYAIAGGGISHELNDPETRYLRDETIVRDAGLDVKFGLTSNLTLDITANTDFAQVEADDAQVNLTRFSLFFPEKRRFFQERSSIFEVGTGGPTRLFYSRRIGLTEDGDQVRLLGGARMIGRVGKWDVGLMNMQTAKYEDIVPSENFGVYRLRRRVLNDASYAGGIVTSRLGRDGSYNVVYGIDGILSVFANDRLYLNWAQTFGDKVDLNKPLNSALLRIHWERQALQGVGYSAFAKWLGPDYDPGMGFNLREDFLLLSGEFSYGMRAPDASFIHTRNVGAEGSVFVRNEDGRVETAEFGPQYFTMFKNNAFFLLSPQASYEHLLEPFELSDDVEVPVGDYWFYTLMMAGQTPLRLLRAEVRMMAGTFYDGWRITAGVEPTWVVSRHLEVSGAVQLNRVSFPNRNASFSGDVIRIRLAGALNSQLSAGTYVQFNSAEDAVSVNFRLRYNPREGNDLYVVYNEGVNTTLDRSPIPPRSQNRTLLVKYAYTFLL